MAMTAMIMTPSLLSGDLPPNETTINPGGQVAEDMGPCRALGPGARMVFEEGEEEALEGEREVGVEESTTIPA